MRGGYVNLDCVGLDLIKGSTEQSISGIYSKVKDAMNQNKPIYACNAVWGSNGVVTPIEVFCIDFGDYIIATASTLQVVITKADKVTINNMAPAN